MRIGYDLRPAQGPSKDRGIGRYTRSLLCALAEAAEGAVDWVLIAWQGHPLPDLNLPATARVKTVSTPDGQRPVLQALRRVGKGGPAMLLHRRLDRQALARIARFERLDALLLPALFERDFFGAENLACPTIKICHDLTPHFTGEAYGQGRTYARMYRQEVSALAQADAVIAISEAARRDVIAVANADPSRVSVIYQGLDSAFRPIPADKKDAIKKRFSPNLPFFLASGGFGENKNLETVIDSLGRLHEQGNLPARLLALGCPSVADHPRRRVMEEHASRFGLQIGRDILLLPHVSDEDLAALYTASAALVFPSRFEGFGLPPAECMACGAPVIVSDVTSLPEVVGDAGITVGPDDSMAIAAAMERLLNDNSFREERIAQGLQQAARFTWDKTAERTWAVLKSVAVHGACS